MDQSTQYYTKALSSLEKVFPDVEPKLQPECNVLTGLKNETISFQAAYAFDCNFNKFAKVVVTSPIEDAVRVREVKLVPVQYPAHKQTDDNYLRTTPGLYPDLLSDLEDGQVLFVSGRFKSLWIDVKITEEMDAGTYPIKIAFLDPSSGEELCCVNQDVTIYDVVLKEQTLIRTEWFHGDCLANYYKVPVFSELHWRIMENFIAAGVKRGMNMFLTPLFTPPLDTAKGGERTTIQLVDIQVNQGVYTFDFEKLKRWVDMCQRVGVKYFEMSHLFTQWGAVAAPKVMAVVDGEYKQIFGWDTQAVGGAYEEFLHIYLPELTDHLKEWKIDKQVYFHISDEPTLEQIDSYTAAKESVSELLKDYIIIDALSDYEFYKTGAVPKPISANNHIHTFLEHDVKNMWSYYCTGQYIDVSNRFMAMPSSRNRCYGVQLFKYDIEGMLHWGYNFYNSQNSIYEINPYEITDSMQAFPAGDPFLVYPKADGTPEESIRMMVLDETMADLRALNYLSELAGKDRVMELIEEDLGQPITFFIYPKSDMYYIGLRNRVNREIAKLVAKSK